MARVPTAFVGWELWVLGEAVTTGIRIEVLPARLGDCLLVECLRDSGRPWRMLVDGGPPDTWPVLEQRLRRLDSEDRHIDVAVVTHIDSDHIGGMIPFLGSEYAEHVSDYWFNGRTHLPQPRARRSVARVRASWPRCWAGPADECCRGTWHSAVVRSTPAPKRGSSRCLSTTDRTSRYSRRRQNA